MRIFVKDALAFYSNYTKKKKHSYWSYIFKIAQFTLKWCYYYYFFLGRNSLSEVIIYNNTVKRKISSFFFLYQGERNIAFLLLLLKIEILSIKKNHFIYFYFSFSTIKMCSTKWRSELCGKSKLFSACLTIEPSQEFMRILKNL